MTDLVEDFLKYIELVRAYSRHTVRAYRRELSNWQSYLEELGANIEHINMPLARSYIAYLRSKTCDNTCGRSHELSNRSINRSISVLKSFYKYLQKQHAVELGSPEPEHNLCNPWHSVSLLPQPQRLPNYLSLEELQKLAEACQLAFKSLLSQKLCRAFLELGFSSGMRVSELCSLNEVQFIKHSTNANDVTSPIRGAYIARKILVTGKGGKQRFVFVGSGSVAALVSYLTERQHFLHLRQKDGAVRRDDGALFCNRHGARLQPRSAHYMLSHLGTVAGLKRPLHPHLLRHSFATTLLNHGAGIRSVQELLGHSSLDSTQIYTHVGIQHLREIHRLAHPRAKRASKAPK